LNKKKATAPKSLKKVISSKRIKKGDTLDQDQKKDPTIKESPVHVLIRVRSEDGQTISEHRNMIVSKGSAVLGKTGQTLAPDFIMALNKQIAKGVETYLFLTTREGWNGPYVTYQCRLKGVERQLAESKLDLVPKYYSWNYKNVTTWFEISSLDKMSKLEMNQIFVLSSGRSIMSVINSSAVVFKVGLKTPEKIPN
jgi:hypothetical protein